MPPSSLEAHASWENRDDKTQPRTRQHNQLATHNSQPVKAQPQTAAASAAEACVRVDKCATKGVRFRLDKYNLACASE